MITPINDKSNILKYLFTAYLIILIFYVVMCVTAVFTFDQDSIYDMYTLNFVNDPVLERSTWHNLRYFFGLFPVFTLSTSFPIIAVTLCNNLKSLFELCLDTRNLEDRVYRFWWSIFLNLFVPLLTVIPPAIVAYKVSDLEFLVGITGSYAGAGIQYITPAMLDMVFNKILKSHFIN